MSEKKRPEERVANIPPFGLRMLPDLKARVADAAEANGRSMNAEIVARLEASFGGADDLDSNMLLDQLRQWRTFALEAVKDIDRIKAKRKPPE